MTVSLKIHPTKTNTIQLYLNEKYVGDETLSNEAFSRLSLKENSLVEATFDDDDEPAEDDGKIPEEFLFESKMIFISNLKDIPQAIGDRVLAVALNYTKDQALDLVQSKMEHLCPEYPELTLKDKQEIIDFMRTNKGHAPRITFRMFIAIAVLKMSGSPQWKQWAYLQMKEAQG